MTQQEKFLLEQNFDAYSNTVLRITTQNTMNYHNAEDVVQGVIRFTINFCCNLNRFTVIRRRVSLHIYPRVAGAYTKAARGETQRGLPFYYERMLIDETAEVMWKISEMVGSDLHCARKMLCLELEDWKCTAMKKRDIKRAYDSISVNSELKEKVFARLEAEKKIFTEKKMLYIKLKQGCNHKFIAAAICTAAAMVAAVFLISKLHLQKILCSFKEKHLK